MTCEQITSELLSALADGQIPPKDRQHLREHLSSCIPCRKRLFFHESMRGMVQNLPPLAPPPRLKEKIMDEVKNIQMEETMDWMRSRSTLINMPVPSRRWIWATASAVAAIVLALGIWIVLPRSTSDDSPKQSGNFAQNRNGAKPMVKEPDTSVPSQPKDLPTQKEETAQKPAAPVRKEEPPVPIEPEPHQSIAEDPEPDPATVQKSTFETAPGGRIAHVHKTLYRLRQGQTNWEPINAGDVFELTDSFRTEADSKAALTLDGKHILCLNKETEFRMSRGENETTIHMTKGEILVSYTPAPDQPSGKPVLAIETPHARAAIRGTQFDVRVNLRTSSLAVLTGEVQFKNAAGEVSVTQGRESHVLENLAPTTPAATDLYKTLGWIDDLAGGVGPHLAFVQNVQAQANGKPDQKVIDQAIKKGSQYLIKHFEKGITPASSEFELVIYTLIHADENPQDVPLLKQGIEDLINFDYFPKAAAAPQPKTRVKPAPQGVSPFTYRVALRSLALHALLVNISTGRKGYAEWKPKAGAIQKKIAESAQALVDSQTAGGMWTYGGALTQEPEAIKNIVTGKWNEGANKVNKTASKEAWHNASQLTGVLYKLKPKYGAKGTDIKAAAAPGGGDNSNTQYGILGLIAAQYSGVEVPQGTWDLALKWFESAQSPNGGFGYHDASKQTAVTTRRRAAAQPVYGSMTTAGAVALAAGYKYLGKDFKNEAKLKSAMDWLTQNFSVSENPGVKYHHYYYLYGLERAAAFARMDKLGTHDWYAEGAGFLLKSQDASGGWSEAKANPNVKNAAMSPTDTSFAVLFLKRATQHLIDTGEKYIDSGANKFIDNK